MKRAPLLVLAVSVLSCGDSNLEVASSAPAAVGVQAQSLTYLAGSTPWQQLSIPVCWNSPARHDQDVLDRATVQREVENAWEQETGIQFSGWGDCPLISPGVVRIVVDDNAWPLTDGVNVVLPFNPRTTGSFPTYSCSPRDLCLINNSIHEFGHILRYGHEQARGDTPGSCTIRQPGGEPPISGFFGSEVQMPWDALSVMNYCTTSTRQLSAVDIAGATYDYGHIRSVSAVSMEQGREDVFFRGRSNDLGHAWNDANGSGTESLGGFITSAPAAVSPSPGQLVVFALGGYGHMFKRTYAPGGWSSWMLMGTQSDVFEGDPEAVVNVDGSITVVARQRRMNSGAVRLVALNTSSNQWTPLQNPTTQSLRFAPTGRPAVTPTALGTLVVFRTFGGALHAAEFFKTSWRNTFPNDVAGVSRLILQGDQSVRGSPSSVYVAADGSTSIVFRNIGNGVSHIRVLGTTVLSNDDLGGLIRASPVVTSFDSGASIDVFVRGQGDGLFHQYVLFGPKYLSGWNSLGGQVAGGPSVASTGYDRLSVFGRAGNGRLTVTRWNGSSWSGVSEVSGTNLR